MATKSRSRGGRIVIAAFATAALALSAFSPASLAYAVQTAEAAAAGGGRALVVVEDGFDPAAFASAGLSWEPLAEAGDAQVTVADIDDDATAALARQAAAAEPSVSAAAQARAASVARSGLAARVEQQAQAAGEPAQTGASYRQGAALQGIYLVTSPSLTDDDAVARAAALDGVLFAEADQVVATANDLDGGETAPDAPANDWGDDASGGAPEAVGAAEGGSASPSSSASVDLTPLQWQLGNSWSMRNAADPVDVNKPDDLTGDGVVIAVVDSGVDYTHPDLAGSMVDLSQYRSEDGALLTESTGCGPYGIDATDPQGSAEYADPMDTFEHGTHVAGIIAANGAAQGVAPDARLVAVKVISEDGSSTGAVYTSSIVRGLGWLVTAKEDYGLNVQGFNFSIGGLSGATYAARAAFALAENSGIVAFVASGNNGQNLDDTESILSSVQTGNTVVVDAADANGSRAYYSNTGFVTTDLFAPGSSILSTVPSSQAKFYPSVSKLFGEALVYEGFEGEGAQADGDAGGGLEFRRFDDSAPNDAGEALSPTSDKFYLGSSSLPIVLDTQEKTSIEDQGQALTAYYLKGTAVTEPKNLTALAGWSGSTDANPLRLGVSAYSDTFLTGGVESSSFGATVSFRLKSDAAGEAEGEAESGEVAWSDPMMIKASFNGTEWVDLPEAALGDLKVVGDDIDFENFQMRIELSIVSFEEGSLPNGHVLYIDAVGLGYGTQPYAFMSGTSMATPSVTGSYAALREARPSESPLRTAARIVGGADASDDLSGLCSTGGRLDVEKALSNPGPRITSAVCENGRLTLEGWFFGEGSGAVSVGGAAAKVLSWDPDSDTEPGRVVVSLPEGASGTQTIVLTRQDGESSQTSSLVEERMTDFADLTLPDGDEYAYAERGSLAAAGGNVYLQILTIPEATVELRFYRYSPARDAWEALGSLPAEGNDLASAAGLVSVQDAVYRYRNDGPSADDNPRSATLSIYPFDEQADEFSDEPLALDAPVGPVDALVSWGSRLVAVGADLEGDAAAITLIDPETGATQTLGTFPIGLTGANRGAVVSGDVLYVHEAASVTDEDATDRILAFDLKTGDEIQAVGTGPFDKTLPYCISLAGTNGDVAVLGMPGYPEALGGAYADVWTAKGDNLAAGLTPSDILLQAGGTAELSSAVAGDTLYVWGISRSLDERTFFRSLPLKDLGMSAESAVEQTPIEPTTPPQTTPVDADEPDLSKLASTGDSSATPIVLLAAVAGATACFAATRRGARGKDDGRREE